MARIYDTKQWQRVRKAVLERDGYRCQIKGPRCKVVAKAVDHIRPLSEDGDPYDAWNCRAACVSCNSQVNNERRAALARYAINGGRRPGTTEQTWTSRDWDGTDDPAPTSRPW